MKHGDKAKKTAQAVKASAKKSSGKEALAKASPQGGKSKTASKEAGSKETGKETAGKKSGAPAPVKASEDKGGNGKTKAADNGGFNNPLVGAAFKRALKKYSNPFRRLTD